ncbi:MAG: hypothetical protein Aureis2KO_07360 [Aureisphaera sp.]
MSTLKKQTIDFSVDNPKATKNLSLPLYQGAAYRADFDTWSLIQSGGFMKFNLSLSEAIPVEWTMNICAALVNGKANNPISITVNGKSFVNSYSEHNANFHDVSWVIPSSLLQKGDNEVRVILDSSATTQLFIKAVGVDQAVLSNQSIDLSIPNPSQSAQLSMPLYQGAGYRADYRTWSLLVDNGFMRFQLDISNPIDVALTLNICSALVNGVANSPSTVTVNGTTFWNLNPKSGNFGPFSKTIPASSLKAGANIIELSLDDNATGQLFINEIMVYGG